MKLHIRLLKGWFMKKFVSIVLTVAMLVTMFTFPVNVPVIDLHQKTGAWLTQIGEVASSDNVMLVKLGEQMFADEAAGVLTGNYITEMYCDEGADNRTHLVEKGARYVAEIIVNSMRSQSAAFAKYVK